MSNYTIIHAHSCYSFQDGAQTIEDYVKKVKTLGMRGASLTEHGNMASSLKFYHECKKQGINPIIGVEAYINDGREDGLVAQDYQEGEDEDSPEDRKDQKNSHLLLLAKNHAGFQDLVRISGEAMLNGFKWKPRTTNNLVLEKAGNFIVTTACMASQFSRAILTDQWDTLENLLWQYKEAFKDDFYAELQMFESDEQKKINAALLKYSEKFEIPVILGLDAHYLDADDWELQQIKMYIKQNISQKDLNDPNSKKKPWKIESKELFVKSYDEIFATAKRLGYDYTRAQIAKWLETTNEINSKVNIEIPPYDIKYPHYQTPKGQSIEEFFKESCIDGFKRRFQTLRIPKDKVKDYANQLNYEIQTIIDMGFASYFLIIRDTLDRVRIMGGRVGAGRGSVVGSLAAFCLGITNLDPIKYNLYFERFINPHRKDPVDIDVDISSDEQKKVEQFLKDEYGKDSVCHVANYVHFGPKNAFRDISRFFNWDYGITNTLAKEMDDNLNIKENWKKLKKKFLGPEYQKFFTNAEPELLKWGPKLENQVRHIAQHASGTVIAPGKLYDYIPLLKYKDEILTAYAEGTDIREVSEIGLIKLDLLGLNHCSIINDAINLVMKTKKKDISNDLENDNLEDKNVYDRFAIEDTLDIFQFGSEGMRQMLRETNPETLDDLATINALFRPATIKAGLVAQYMKNKKDPSSIKYVHPKLQDILGRTYGVLVFQEQVMEIFRVLGGFTLAEADDLRKQMKLVYHSESVERKKSWEEVMNRFKENAMRQGLGEFDATMLLDQMMKYANYSFNAAHAYGYALNAYQQMWLKIKYPLEYYCSLLNRSSQDDLATNIQEARKKGIQVEYLSVNNSEWAFTIKGNKIICGLSAIKGCSENDFEKLKASRPFLSIDSFFEKVFEAGVSKRSIEPLINLGLLDELNRNRKALWGYYEAKRAKKKKDPEPIFDDTTPDYLTSEQIAFEREYLGFFWNQHPLSDADVKATLQEMGVSYVSQAKLSGVSSVVGLVGKSVTKKTKNGKMYAIYEIEDDNGNTMPVKCWDTKTVWKEGDILVFKELSHDSYGYSVRSSDKIEKLSVTIDN